MLIVAVVFGGGGSRAGGGNLVVQLTALIAFGYYRHSFVEFFKDAPRPLSTLVALTILLPLLQCVPLPPAIWHHLPGRDLAIQSLSLVAQQDSWMPFSVNVRRTFIAFLALLPPLAILVLVWRVEAFDRRVLLAVVVACGAAAVALGAQQLAFGNRGLMLYSEAVGSQDLQGTFANRNTTGLFLDIALCALIGLMWGTRPGSLRIGAGVIVGALLLLGLVLTRSRSSIALASIPAVLLLFLLLNSREALFSKKPSRFIALVAVLAMMGMSLGLLGGNARIEHSLSRFNTFQDARPAIWQDTGATIARFWPLGSGVGTFDDVFQIDESLENLGFGRAARAHNDYLEATLESGILGLVFVGGWIAIVTITAWHCLRHMNDRGLRVAALAVFVLMACQSILDYPLRSQTMLCVAGLMLGILIAQSPADARAEVGKR